MLAARGVNPHKITALGRWQSPLVIRYAGAALATGLTRDLCIAAGVGPNPGLAPVSILGAGVSTAVEARLGCQESTVTDSPPPPETEEIYSLVINLDSRAIHWYEPSSLDTGLDKTRCGWAYKHRNAEFRSARPDMSVWHSVCERCLPELRNQLCQEYLAASDTD